MRILLLNDYFAPIGGAELQVARLRDLLTARGHEVRVLASRAGAEAGSDPDASCYGTMHPRLRVLTETVNPSAVRALRAALAEFRPDVVHVRMFLTQLSPLILPLLRDVPAVYHAVYYKSVCPRGTKLYPDGLVCHEPAGRACLRNRCRTPQSWVLDMTQQALWRRWRGAFDAIIGVSETVRTRLEANGIGPVEVLRNGVAPRPARPPLTDPPTVAYAGRLVEEKGPDLLLAAFARVADDHPGARLILAGDGPLRERLTAETRALGVGGRVSLPGRLPRTELEARLDAAWVHAVPGRWEEPLGNVTLEGMMRGTAMLVTAIGGPAEVVEAGHTGLLVPPGEVGPLAAALDRLLGDRALAERLGAAGRQVALREHGEDRVCARLEAIYARITARYARA